MKYRYLTNLKSKKAIGADDISTKSKDKPKFKSKAKFREWCADIKTDHVFYSMCSGDNPALRISNDNPINSVSGVVADYDAPVDWDMAHN